MDILNQPVDIFECFLVLYRSEPGNGSGKTVSPSQIDV